MNTSPYPITGSMKTEPYRPLEEDDDMVERPQHYTWHPVAECKAITQEFNYNLGTAIAYIWRAGRKYEDAEVEDLRKAIKHIEFECDRLKLRTQPR